MIEFNYFLTAAGIDLAKARLVRHQDNRAPRGRTPYDLWRAQTGAFERYQEIQHRDIFSSASIIASFVATPLNETIFVGLYEVLDKCIVPAGTLDPVGCHDVSGFFQYKMVPDRRLESYSGRIVIEWGSGARAWVQRPDKQNKAVIEIRRESVDPPFPGFADFRHRINDLNSVPISWRIAMSAVSGVYLLTCIKSGKQYVGSAYGEGGFWRRWEYYSSSGHGGNVAMKKIEDADYQVSILEVSASTAHPTEIIEAEARWKNKLLTRSFGLNMN